VQQFKPRPERLKVRHSNKGYSVASSCGGTIRHSLGWNGHTLIGYSVAIIIAA
jgi:hypothetical protein